MKNSKKKFTANYTLHEGTWTVRVIVGNKSIAISDGKTYREARQNIYDAVECLLNRNNFEIEHETVTKFWGVAYHRNDSEYSVDRVPDKFDTEEDANAFAKIIPDRDNHYIKVHQFSEKRINMIAYEDL